MILGICVWLSLSALSASGVMDGYLKLLGVSRTAACALSLAIAASGVLDAFTLLDGLAVVPGTALALLLCLWAFLACKGEEKIVAAGAGVIAAVGIFLLSELSDGWSLDDFNVAVAAGFFSGIVIGMFTVSPRSAFAAAGLGVLLGAAGKYAVSVTHGYALWDSGASSYITLALASALSGLLCYVSQKLAMKRRGMQRRRAPKPN